jgi:hypothetical protein
MLRIEEFCESEMPQEIYVDNRIKPKTRIINSELIKRLWSGEPACGALVVPSEEPALFAPPEGDGSAAGAQKLDCLLIGSDLSSAAYA